ncbi:MAG: NAD-dependent epimerase/dehydratase family protein [Candidatus Andersenbacteria bacterium]|nr:NAD-dependent epimerase/dehydratase family protein [Candidatus Andersenbacteria bacterium]
MATYLVTGGAGFIGSNVVRELVRRRQKVVVLDNLVTGKRENLAEVWPRIRFIAGDIRDLDTVAKAMRHVTYVLHQAALRAVERSVDDPRATNDTNITGTLNVLLAARENRVRRVVFASSSSVYGGTSAGRQTEAMLLKPASPYALTKLAGENYCRLFSDLFGLFTVSLRYFNVFGPYQNPESKYSAVIPIFVQHLRRGEPPEIHWHGRQSRDFTYVDNIVAANLLAATGRRVRSGEVYNIGNGRTTSVRELYDALQALLGSAIEPRRGRKRRGDVLRTFADVRKARRDFGYVPSVTFADGLARAIAWYKANLS